MRTTSYVYKPRWGVIDRICLRKVARYCYSVKWVRSVVSIMLGSQYLYIITQLGDMLSHTRLSHVRWEMLNNYASRVLSDPELMYVLDKWYSNMSPFITCWYGLIRHHTWSLIWQLWVWQVMFWCKSHPSSSGTPPNLANKVPVERSHPIQ